MLPDELRYLQPFVEFLSTLPPDELNEDVDPSLLEEALLERIAGLKLKDAEKRLAQDRRQLEQWLKTNAEADHPAYWIAGFLLQPKLAALLLEPPLPESEGPRVEFEPPDGWKMTSAALQLGLKKGKMIASIMVIDEFSFSLMQRQREKFITPGEIKATADVTDVCCGDTRGKKYLYLQTEPAPWKNVDYLLKVPGGHVVIALNALGADFDEAPFEQKLHTLRLRKPE